MIKVKICGLTSSESVEYVNMFIPEYAGFVFAPSKRQVNPEIAFDLRQSLDNKTKAVGVFVNTDVLHVRQIAELCNLDIIQLHGDEDNSYIDQLKNNSSFEIWKAIQIKDINDINKIDQINSDKILLDAYSQNAYGGIGKVFNHELLNHIDKKTMAEKIIIAGGLNINTVNNILNKFSPYALDVSSGVETNGEKDLSKIGDFINKVRNISDIN